MSSKFKTINAIVKYAMVSILESIFMVVVFIFAVFLANDIIDDITCVDDNVIEQQVLGEK